MVAEGLCGVEDGSNGLMWSSMGGVVAATLMLHVVNHGYMT
jgi:hypothetical protein